MNAETIGTWAGLMWNALNEVESLGLKQVKKETKLKDKIKKPKKEKKKEVKEKNFAGKSIL